MVLAIIVTYNPMILCLRNNIEIILNEFHNLIIFDNNSHNITNIEQICAECSIPLIKNKQNYGLPYAYNYIIKSNISNYDYFATFDQDTLIPDNYLSNLLPLFNTYPKVGVVGPSFAKSSRINNKEFYSSDMLLQSGSIISKKVFQDIGFFHEPLFIDAVEFDFFLRARYSGYKLIKSNTVFINHTIGEKKRSFGIHYTSHSAIRNFYFSRNHIYLTRTYFLKFPFFILKKNIFFLLHIIKIIFLDRDANKIKNIFYGLTSSFK
jgi:rhamnosyltransferase